MWFLLHEMSMLPINIELLKIEWMVIKVGHDPLYDFKLMAKFPYLSLI